MSQTFEGNCDWALSTAEKTNIARVAGYDYLAVPSERNFVEVVGQVTDNEGCSEVYEAIGKDTLQ